VDADERVTVRGRRGPGRLDERTLRVVLTVLGLADVALGVWMALWPGSFSRSLGGFGVRNDHDIRDAATWSLALGLALLCSVRRRSWRVPLLFLGSLQVVLHIANHIADVADANPLWAGPVDVVLLTVQGVAFAVALGSASRATPRRGTARARLAR